MSKTEQKPDLGVRLINAIAYLVKELPRGKNKETGAEYKGLRQDRCDLVPAFMALMARWEHPLAGVQNKNCSWEKPCNSCQRCVYNDAVNGAVEKGLVVRVPVKGKTFRDDRTRKLVQGKGFVLFYRPDEYVGRSGVSESFIDDMAKNL
jgi:hypothetical protein